MKKIKGYKGFDKGLKCKGFQFKENKNFKFDGDIKLCKKGFHFCENPLDILNYYNLCESEFAEVESLGKIRKTKEDTKIVTDKIKIKTKIDLPLFIEASINFLFEKCEIKSGDYSKQASSGDYSKQASSGYSSQQASSGDYSQQASSGYSSQQASSGDYSQQASSGDYSQQASSGDYSQQASSGDYSQQASSGYSSQQASSGDYSQQASSGDYSQQASSGDYSKQASSGYSSQHIIDGKNSIAMACGENSKMKGKKGNWIVLAEYNNKNEVIAVVSGKIDGKKLKEDVWYEVKNKKFVEIII
ncbi:MAG: hypothetical protein U9P90_01045 [Patescibacteria group bacterium]|nr:hypothetical protein [Patescibacteria group bacterium]